MRASAALGENVGSSTIARLAVVLVAVAVMTLGFAAINQLWERGAECEIAVLSWCILSGLLITSVGAAVLARLGSPIGAYILLIGALVVVTWLGMASGAGIFEFCGRDATPEEALVLPAFTLVASLIGVVPGYLVGHPEH